MKPFANFAEEKQQTFWRMKYPKVFWKKQNLKGLKNITTKQLAGNN